MLSRRDLGRGATWGRVVKWVATLVGLQNLFHLNSRIGRIE